MSSRRFALAAGAIALAGIATPVLAQGAVAAQYRWLTFAVFGVIISITMYVTYLAAKRVKNVADFYAAGGGVSGLQNGWAIAGDYLSAASFLGIAGLISLYGYDGFMYSVGWLVAYITVLLVIAEPCRNIGKYTLSDILAYRNNQKAARIVGALSTITVSTFYLTAQMVGGGVLVKTLIGIDYEISVMVVGVLMLAYVLFGGMVATTWVQIIKAILLVTASILLVILVWTPYGFSLPAFLTAVIGDADVQAQVALLLGDAGKNMTPEQLGQRFLEPGLLFKAPIDQISLGMALVFGTAGMPHILMRFFTVPTAQDARKSVIWAMAIIGGFYVLTLFLGMGSAMHVGAVKIKSIDAGGNMAGPLLAQYLGGGPDSMLGNLFLAFVAAVAFATIVAVVAGLVLAAASAMAHDLYVGVIRAGARDAGRAGARGAHRDGRRRRDGHHDRHPVEGPERRAPRGVGVRGRVVGQLPLRAADAVLEALQHRRHRARHDRRHADGDRAGAGLAEPHVSARGQGRAGEDRRDRDREPREAQRRPRGRDRGAGAGQAQGGDRQVREGEGGGRGEDQGDRQRPHVDRRAREAGVRSAQSRA